MYIKQKLVTPLILTIPDDTAVFSILNPEEKISKKIIMENYINFYAYREPTYKTMVFRFENFMNYENINGLDHCFIPMSLLKKYYGIEIILQLIREGYVITLPVMRKCFEFYGDNAKGTHIMFIYGMDTVRKVLVCRDFDAHKFVDFEVSFEAVEKSMLIYERSYTVEEEGMLAFKVSKTVSPEIDYAKVFFEFKKLMQEIFSYNASYGVGAINAYINDINIQPTRYLDTNAWYHFANYLREATKLIPIRFNILKEDLLQKEVNEYNIKVIDKLNNDITNLFSICSKALIRGTELTVPKVKEYAEYLYICKEDFKAAAELFCSIILSYSNQDICDKF